MAFKVLFENKVFGNYNFWNTIIYFSHDDTTVLNTTVLETEVQIEVSNILKQLQYLQYFSFENRDIS